MSNQERVAERRKHWGELIARQQQSGKTVKAFCEENGVGGPSFYAWRKRPDTAYEMTARKMLFA